MMFAAWVFRIRCAACCLVSAGPGVLAPAARVPVNPPVSPNAVTAMTAIARIASGALIGRRPRPGRAVRNFLNPAMVCLSS
jgi:hypothetical protein